MPHAVRLLRRSAELEQSADTFSWLAFNLAIIGRPAMGLRYAKMTWQLDALAVLGPFMTCLSELLLGAPNEDSIAALRTIALRDEQDHSHRMWLAIILLGRGRVAEVEATLRDAHIGGAGCAVRPNSCRAESVAIAANARPADALADIHDTVRCHP